MAALPGISSISAQDLASIVRDQLETGQKPGSGAPSSAQNQTKSFGEYLSEGINSLNQQAQGADRMSAALATGKSENLHETMLALSQVELGFNLLVQVRNKALEAYQDIMRMPV